MKPPSQPAIVYSYMPTDDPLFTILTVTLNRCHTIQNTLESLCNQNYNNFEHIVVDGKSTDGTVQLLQGYEHTYNLKWISEPDNGISDALNKAIKIARGQFLLVLQADDSFLDHECLSKIYRFIEQHPSEIYSFPVLYCSPDKEDRIVNPIRHLWWYHFKFIFHHQGCIVKRTVFKRVGKFRKQFKISMDYDFFYRALKLNTPVTFGSFPFARMNSGGISGMILERIAEERRVQKLNEDKVMWRMAQLMFGCFYVPYKRLHCCL